MKKHCSEPMDLTTEYGLGDVSAISSSDQMDFTVQYNRRQSANDIMRRSSLRASQTAQKVNVPIIQNLRSPNAVKIQPPPPEPTVNLTMAFNASIYSKSIKEMLLKTSNKLFSSQRAVAMNMPKPIRIDAIRSDNQLLVNEIKHLQELHNQNLTVLQQLQQVQFEQAAAWNRRQSLTQVVRLTHTGFELPQLQQVTFADRLVKLQGESFQIAATNFFKVQVFCPFSQFGLNTVPVRLIVRADSGPNFAKLLGNECTPPHFRSIFQKYENEVAVFLVQERFIDGVEMDLAEMNYGDLENLCEELTAKSRVYERLLEIIQKDGVLAYSHIVGGNMWLQIQKGEKKAIVKDLFGDIVVFIQNREVHGIDAISLILQ